LRSPLSEEVLISPIFNKKVVQATTRVQSDRLSWGIESVGRLVGSNCGIENCVVEPLGSEAWLSNNIFTTVVFITGLELEGLADSERFKWWLIYEEVSDSKTFSVVRFRDRPSLFVIVSVSTNWFIQISKFFIF
jgi:hypothetical protein